MKKKEPNSRPAHEKAPKQVFLEIFVQKHGRGFMYRALAKTEWGQQITVEGYASGSQKEVERVVQKRVQKVIDDHRKRRAKEVSGEPTIGTGENSVLQPAADEQFGVTETVYDRPPENASSEEMTRLIQSALEMPITVSYTMAEIEKSRSLKITYTLKPSTLENGSEKS